ncbi:MAG: hypothetical protein ABEJ99_00445 [Candidatus Nanohaloarchaea archaeon]
MGLNEDYADKVNDVEDSIDSVFTREDASRMKSLLDNILPFAVLSLFFVLLVGYVIPVNYAMVQYINYVNWFVMIYFAARLAVGFRLARSKNVFLEQHWLDFALVIPAFSLLQQFQMLQVFEESEVMGIGGGELLGSVAITQIGTAAKLTRVTRVLKKTFIG